MILGVDTSTYLEEEEAGSVYRRKGKAIDPLDAFVANGVRYNRIRLWVDPYGEGHQPYLGGTVGTENFLRLAKIYLAHGMRLMLDFHFSDFWCDPGKQNIPKSWDHESVDALEKQLRDYVLSTLSLFRKEGLEFDFIQVGNEITNGFLWPLGRLRDEGDGKKRGNYGNFLRLLLTAVEATKEIYPEAKIILHLERSNDQAVYREFFDEVASYGIPYDIIGMSYYPFWHGTMDELFANVDQLEERYEKDVMIVETGYGFTLEDYYLSANGTNQLVVSQEAIEKLQVKLEFPLTEEGQAAFLASLMAKAKEHGVKGIFYWEPLWIPGKNVCWASREGQRYIGELGKETRNEWANQALYDYDGNALKALSIFHE